MSPLCRETYDMIKSVSKAGRAVVLTSHCPASRGLTALVPPLLMVPWTSLEAYANALEALAVCGGRREAGVRWHPSGELARLERASGCSGGLLLRAGSLLGACIQCGDIEVAGDGEGTQIDLRNKEQP